MQKTVIFGVIVLMHVAALIGLLHTRTSDQTTPAQAAIAVRLLSPPAEQERLESPPIEIATITPRIAIDPPDVPILDIQAEESPRAITIPVHMSAPVPRSEARHMPKLVSSVEYIREPVPRYPAQSRKLREQGLVMLKVLVDERGVACSIEIESSSGYARLDHAAREAVARAAFRPYVEDGEPRRALVLIPIEFYLNRSSA